MVTIHKNEQMQELIRELRTISSTSEAPLWRAVAENLERSTRSRAAVNLTRLNRFTKKDEVIVVPGKVLGDGELGHSITIAALGFSQSAIEKLNASKTTMITITELAKKDPKGKKIRVFA